MEQNIVVVGAGVAGLTSALRLSQNQRYKITVVAKHMPGDYDIEYASPWAGANYMPVSAPGSEAAEWDRRTWGPLQELASKRPEAGVHFQPCRVLSRKTAADSTIGKWNSNLTSPDPWFKDVVPDFKVLPPSLLPPSIDSGTTFTSVCINPAIYLPYLVSRLLSLGVTFHRTTLPHITSALSFVAPSSSSPQPPPPTIIINCTGLSSHTLPGVQDPTLTPARGQTVLVRNVSPSGMHGVSGPDPSKPDLDADDDELCYIMMRPAGGGTVLGGCYQKGNWDPAIDRALSRRIMRRAVELCPELVSGKAEGVEGLDVIREGVGLRPVREGGARLEVEEVVVVDGDGPGLRGEKVTVVHNYGHGGFGYQSSYGCAERVVELVDGVVGRRVVNGEETK